MLRTPFLFPRSSELWRISLRFFLADAIPKAQHGAMDFGNILTIDVAILNGTPVFKGTRVPVRALFNALDSGESTGEFLTEFPDVSNEQILQLLRIARRLITSKKVLTENPELVSDQTTGSGDAGLVTSQTQQLERDIFALVNEHRTTLQLPAFLPDDVCTIEAQAHSINMAAGRTPLGHEGFEERIARIAAGAHPGGGGGQAGENTAAGQTTADAVVQGWLSQADFKRNIEGNSRISGVGVARSTAGTNFFTQIYF